MAPDPRSSTRDLRTKKSTAKRSRANVWFVKSDQGNLIERSQERLAIDFLLGSLEWTIAKNQGKMRAIYPLSSSLASGKKNLARKLCRRTGLTLTFACSLHNQLIGVHRLTISVLHATSAPQKIG